MKRVWIFLVAAVTAFILVFYTNNRTATKKQHRAEVYMVDRVGQKVWIAIDAGRSLPTNWVNLSNLVDWPLISGICERYHLPSPTAFYTVLRSPVPYKDSEHAGVVFFIRTKPTKWEVSGLGRWALLVGPNLNTNPSEVASNFNDVFRIWIPETNLPRNIESQLSNQQH